MKQLFFFLTALMMPVFVHAGSSRPTESLQYVFVYVGADNEWNLDETDIRSYPVGGAAIKSEHHGETTYDCRDSNLQYIFLKANGSESQTFTLLRKSFGTSKKKYGLLSVVSENEDGLSGTFEEKMTEDVASVAHFTINQQMNKADGYCIYVDYANGTYRIVPMDIPEVLYIHDGSGVAHALHKEPFLLDEQPCTWDKNGNRVYAYSNNDIYYYGDYEISGMWTVSMDKDDASKSCEEVTGVDFAPRYAEKDKDSFEYPAPYGIGVRFPGMEYVQNTIKTYSPGMEYWQNSISTYYLLPEGSPTKYIAERPELINVTQNFDAHSNTFSTTAYLTADFEYSIVREEFKDGVEQWYYYSPKYYCAAKYCEEGANAIVSEGYNLMVKESGNYTIVFDTNNLVMTFSKPNEPLSDGIDSVKVPEAQLPAMYDIHGIKVNGGYKGMIISDGKKMLVR